MKPRELDLRDFDGVLDEVRRLRADGYEKAGNWDLAQMCQHIAIPIRDSMDGFSFEAPLAIRVLGPLVFKKRIFSTRRLRDGIKAPREIEPPPGLDADTEIRNLEALITRFRAHTGALHPSPFLGEMDKTEWEQFNTIHASHHLRYLIPRA
ncbi:MAG: DUF1569 domain-containing protein [Planctomycetes bacterium]|nr:DUF1569 domain-containing protein [Planctomycetota bacterium]